MYDDNLYIFIHLTNKSNPINPIQCMHFVVKKAKHIYIDTDATLTLTPTPTPTPTHCHALSTLVKVIITSNKMQVSVIRQQISWTQCVKF